MKYLLIQFALVCLFLLSCDDENPMVWSEDSGSTDGNSGLDCSDPCKDESESSVPGCLEICGGAAGAPCPYEHLSCLYYMIEFGTCIPSDALGCASDANCECFPDIPECENSGGTTAWECLNDTCTPSCSQ
ncbi:MAG: hypothetical protein QNJ97_12885 [Myxococcota bacterium]|nr:hypothetical protein [Myxococcota bacterium]